MTQATYNKMKSMVKRTSFLRIYQFTQCDSLRKIENQPALNDHQTIIKMLKSTYLLVCIMNSTE